MNGQLESLNCWCFAADPGTSHFACGLSAIFISWTDFIKLDHPPELGDIFKPEYVLSLELLDLRGMEHRHKLVKLSDCRLNHSSELVDRLRHAIQEYPPLFSPNKAVEQLKSKKISPFFRHWTDALTKDMSIRCIAERQPVHSCHVAITNLLQIELVEKEFESPNPLKLIAPQTIQAFMGTRGQEYNERKTHTVKLAQGILKSDIFPQLHAKDDRVHDMADALILIVYFAQCILLPDYQRLWWKYRQTQRKRKRQEVVE